MLNVYILNTQGHVMKPIILLFALLLSTNAFAYSEAERDIENRINQAHEESSRFDNDLKNRHLQEEQNELLREQVRQQEIENNYRNTGNIYAPNYGNGY